MKTLEGNLTGEKFKFSIVVSRFNSLITERLLEGAQDALLRHGVASAAIEVVRVPGGWELPLAVKWVVETKKFDGVIALSCVIRGGTPHFEYVAGEASKGVAQVMMNSGVPVSFGVLTTDTVEQAIERAGTKHGNKGWDAAMSCLEMADLKRKVS